MKKWQWRLTDMGVVGVLGATPIIVSRNARPWYFVSLLACSFAILGYVIYRIKYTTNYEKYSAGLFSKVKHAVGPSKSAIRKAAKKAASASKKHGRAALDEATTTFGESIGEIGARKVTGYEGELGGEKREE